MVINFVALISLSDYPKQGLLRVQKVILVSWRKLREQTQTGIKFSYHRKSNVLSNLLKINRAQRSQRKLYLDHQVTWHD